MGIPNFWDTAIDVINTNDDYLPFSGSAEGQEALKALNEIPVNSSDFAEEASKDEKEFKEVTIKFSPKLATKFEGKDGKSYYEIKLPNIHEDDNKPWAHFVLPEKAVHEDQYSAKDRLWAKLPADGDTTLRRSVKTDEIDPDGKAVYKEEEFKLSNKTLANMMDPKTRQKISQADRKDVGIRITKKLFGETFRGKDGKEYVEIRIPNEKTDDKTPWAHFVVNPNQVHEDKFVASCNVVYLPEDGEVTVKRDIKTDRNDENGKAVYEKKTEKMSVKDIEKRFKGSRESVKDKLQSKQAEVDKAKLEAPVPDKYKDKSMAI